MSYTIAEVDAEVAASLMGIDEEVYADINSGRFYTYEDIADKVLDPSQYNVTTIPQSAVDGTYPIPRNRRMFPRTVKTS